MRALVAPRLGSFETGDVLDVTTLATFSSELIEDYVFIDQPTKLVIVRVILEHPSVPLPPALLTLTRELDDLPYEMQTIKPRMVEATGNVEFVAVVSYPDPR